VDFVVEVMQNAWQNKEFRNVMAGSTYT